MPYDCLSIGAANLLPRGRTRLVPCQPRGTSPTPPKLGTNLAETSLHPKPLSEDPRGQGTEENPQVTYDGPDPSTWAARPPPSAQRAPASKSSPLLLLLSRRDHLYRISTAKRTHAIRIHADKRQHLSMLTDHWPDLGLASLPVYRRKTAPPPPLPRSMPDLGWIRDPSYRIRLDPPRGLHFPSRTPRRVLHPKHVQALSRRTLTITCLLHSKQVQMGPPLPLT